MTTKKPKVVEADIIRLKSGGRIEFEADGELQPLGLKANCKGEYKSGEGLLILRLEDGVERVIGRLPNV